MSALHGDQEFFGGQASTSGTTMLCLGLAEVGRAVAAVILYGATHRRAGRQSYLPTR